jgi:hypothetical protein
MPNSATGAADPQNSATTTPVPPVNNVPPENVPYSKYIGVKEMLQKAETARDKALTELQTVQASVSGLNEQLGQLKAGAIDPVKHKELQEKLTTAEKAVLEAHQTRIIDKYNIEDEALLKELKGLSLDNLQIFEKGIKSAGKLQPAKPPADRSNGGGGAQAISAMEKIKAGVSALHPN